MLELINTFLTNDLLTQAEPANNAPEDKVTLIEVLDRAAEKVGERYKSDPGLEIAMRKAIANTYYALGSIAKAEGQWQAVHDRAASSPGVDRRELWLSLSERGHMAFHFGRYKEAVELCRGDLDGMERLLGPDLNETLISRNNLASAYESQKQCEKAEPIRRSLLERARRSAPAESPEIAAALAGLGKNLLMEGKPAESEPFLRECLAIREKKLADDWTRFNAMSLLVAALLGQKQYADAEPLSIQVYEGMKVRVSIIPPAMQFQYSRSRGADRFALRSVGQARKVRRMEGKDQSGVAGGEARFQTQTRAEVIEEFRSDNYKNTIII